MWMKTVKKKLIYTEIKVNRDQTKKMNTKNETSLLNTNLLCKKEKTGMENV